MPRRKLQVFVSSTFTDLRDQRQAAVEAILQAGHIPAGMELFGADDKKQMEVIRGWIADSDVFLILLAGRYGSVDAESGKSYTHLEYEHALTLGKPVLAMVMTDDAIEARGRTDLGLIERENGGLLKKFRAAVTDGRLVSFFQGDDELKLHVMIALSNADRREDLVGWVRGTDAVNTAEVLNQLAAATKEASVLRARVQELETQAEALPLIPSEAETPQTFTVTLMPEDKFDCTTTYLHWFLTVGRDFATGISFEGFQGSAERYLIRLANKRVRGREMNSFRWVSNSALTAFAMYGWISVTATAGGDELYESYVLTAQGRRLLLQHAATKATASPSGGS